MVKKVTFLWLSILTTLLGSVVNAESQTLMPSTNGLSWSPTYRGYSRFEIELPRSAVADALRYGDLSDLYYLRMEREVGVSRVYGGTLDVSLGFMGSGSAVKYKYFYNDSNFVSFNFVDYGSGSAAGVELGRIVSSGANKIDVYKFEVGRDQKLTWERTVLAVTEDSEHTFFCGLEIASGELFGSLSLGQRCWGCVGSLDSAYSLGVSENNLFGVLQLEHSLNDVNYFSRFSYVDGKGAGIAIGMEFQFGPLSVNVANHELDRSSIDNWSFGGLRRSELPRLWRKEVTLQRLSSNAGLVSD